MKPAFKGTDGVDASMAAVYPRTQMRLADRVAVISGVPVIDLTAAREGSLADRRRVAHAVDEACREIGFFAIAGHGVPGSLVDDVRRRAHDFFERPLAEKLLARHPVEGMNRGYHSVGGETLSAANDAA